MRDLIHVLKYGGLRPVGRRLGRLLANAIAQLACEAPSEMLVVPVPLHRAKNSERGFNQSRILAAEALACLRQRLPDWGLRLAPLVLLRVRPTQTQAGLTTRQRRLNMRGAFRVSDVATVADKSILLIYDIFTTGATARAAARTLLQAGAESVWVATLARAHRIDGGIVTAEKVERLTGVSEEVVSHLHATMNSQDQPSFRAGSQGCRWEKQ